MPTQRTCKLRVCARCEWIFKTKVCPACPVCGFGSYGARWVYGKRAYTYAKTQKPWKDRKLSAYETALELERIALIKDQGKYREFFKVTTPEYILQLTEREQDSYQWG